MSRTNDDGKGRQGSLSLNRSGTTTAEDTHGDGAGQQNEGTTRSRRRAHAEAGPMVQDLQHNGSGTVGAEKTTAGDLPVKVKDQRTKVRSLRRRLPPVRQDLARTARERQDGHLIARGEFDSIDIISVFFPYRAGATMQGPQDHGGDA
ncbi:hypothetical protein CF319_g9356, partial [Tilletia indica]